MAPGFSFSAETAASTRLAPRRSPAASRRQRHRCTRHEPSLGFLPNRATGSSRLRLEPMRPTGRSTPARGTGMRPHRHAAGTCLPPPGWGGPCGRQVPVAGLALVEDEGRAANGDIDRGARLRGVPLQVAPQGGLHAARARARCSALACTHPCARARSLARAGSDRPAQRRSPRANRNRTASRAAKCRGPPGWACRCTPASSGAASASCRCPAVRRGSG